jgi:3-oxoadipate enol-lactonase
MRTVSLANGDPRYPTVICLPGAMCTPHVYAQSAAHSGLNVQAFGWLEDDGPFDLESIALRILDALPDETDVVLVGHSLGTPLAVLTALAAQERGRAGVRGLVLSNSGANTHGHGDADSVVRRIEEEWGEPMWRAFAARCFHTLPKDALLDELLSYPKQLRSRAVADAIRSQMRTDLLPLLPGLSGMPVAVVHGQHDPARTLQHAEELAGAIDGATLHVLQTGHTSCAEDPVAFARIVRSVAERGVMD